MILALISAFEIKPVSWIKQMLEKGVSKTSIYSLCILFQSCRKTQLPLQLFFKCFGCCLCGGRCHELLGERLIDACATAVVKPVVHTML